MSTFDLDRRLAEIAARPHTRRGVIAGASGLALAAALSRLPLDLAYGAPARHGADPFALGVASGDPAKHGVVLWTRLAPEPLRADGGMAPRPVAVRWELARDPAMRRVVRAGRATAWPAFAHSVHVEVDGLEPGRDEPVYGPYYGPMIPFNPHIRFFDGDRHGSMTARLDRRGLEVDWRIADRVGDPDARVRTLRRFAVEAGRPGLAQV